jgi:hypothetical protein
MSTRKRKQDYIAASPDRSREELIFATLSLPVEADRRVAGLVRMLNDLPDIYTISSCGGHEDPVNRENPAPEGCFYVQFVIEPAEKGLLSLGIIDLAARNTDNENLMVRVLNCTDNPKLVMFSILGKEGVNPDEYTREIRRLCQTWEIRTEGVYDEKVRVRRQAAFDRIRHDPGE